MDTIVLCPPSGTRLNIIKSFVEASDLTWDGPVDVTVCLEERGRLIATGSRRGNVLQRFAVDPNYRGNDLLSALVTNLIQEAYSKQITHLMVYTKPENRDVFLALGFYLIVETRETVLLENRRDGLTDYLVDLSGYKTGGVQGAIVANCNPFTYGHLHLIEYAASHCSTLHLFILAGDNVLFSEQDRMVMVREGIAHLTNVIIHSGSYYVVSQATFPSYFYKDEASAIRGNMDLDLILFATKIAKALEIGVRYVGKEPYCQLTSRYNRRMTELLTGYGIDVIEIPRLEQGGRAISASLVRNLYQEERMADLRLLVPPTTFEHLCKEHGHV